MSKHELNADGTVDMHVRAGFIRHCTWAECPGIEMSEPITSGQHGHFHRLCDIACNAPFVRADIEREVAAAAAPPVAPVHAPGQLVHHLARVVDDDGLCGASAYSPDGYPNFSTLRADVTCKECIDLLDERDFDRAHE